MNVAQVGPLIPSSMTDAEERIGAVGPFKTKNTILSNMLCHYDIHSGCGSCVNDLSGQNIVNCETKSKRSTFLYLSRRCDDGDGGGGVYRMHTGGRRQLSHPV